MCSGNNIQDKSFHQISPFRTWTTVKEMFSYTVIRSVNAYKSIIINNYSQHLRVKKLKGQRRRVGYLDGR